MNLQPAKSKAVSALRRAVLPRIVLVLTLACAVLPLTGCEHDDFKTEGEIRAEGGAYGTWSLAPVGCSRDPLDGLPPAQSTTIATFLWPDPKIKDHLRDGYKRLRPNQPMRLEFSRGPGRVVASIETVHTKVPAVLDSSNCALLQVESSEGSPLIKGGRPSLRGSVELDCRLNDTHITGKVRFSGCEF